MTNPNNCGKTIVGPLGTCVGLCELKHDHDGSCRINGVSEQDMVNLCDDAHLTIERHHAKSHLQ